jgi:hypothetical protein
VTTKYLVLVGLDYGQTRREPGDIATDIPKQSVPWLLEQGAIAEHVAGTEPVAEVK